MSGNSGKVFRTFMMDKANIFTMRPTIIPNSEGEPETLRENAMEEELSGLQREYTLLQLQVSEEAQSNDLPDSVELVSEAGSKLRRITENSASKDVRKLVIQGFCAKMGLPPWIADSEALRAAGEAIGVSSKEEAAIDGIKPSEDERRVVGKYMKSYRERYTAKDLLECLITAHAEKLHAGRAIARSREASKEPS